MVQGGIMNEYIPSRTFTPWELTFREVVLGVLAGLMVVVTLGLGIGLGVRSAASGDAPAGGAGGVCMTRDCLWSSAWVLANLNKSLDPCQDFHKFSCGGWMSRFQLAPDEDERSAFSMLDEQNSQRLRSILDSPIKRLTPNSAERKLKTFFATCRDDYSRGRNGGKPLVEAIKGDLNGWYVFNPENFKSGSTWDIQAAMSRIHGKFLSSSIVRIRVVTDPDNSKKGIILIDPYGLGMSSFNYLDPDRVRVKTAYYLFMETVASLVVADANITNPNSTMDILARIGTYGQDVSTFEGEMAKLWSKTKPGDRRYDPSKRMSLDAVNGIANEINWVELMKSIFPDANLDGNTPVILYNQNYLRGVNNLIKNAKTANSRQLNNYMVWRLAQAQVTYLSWDYLHANRQFYKASTGNSEFRGLWRYCFDLVDQRLPIALGTEYAKAHFTRRNMISVDTIYRTLKTVLKGRLDKLTWMDEETRRQAADKMDSVTDKLGYPSFVNDDDQVDSIFAALDISYSYSFYQNMMNTNKLILSDWTNLLTKGEDRSDWRFKVYANRAQYNLSWNELVIPAGAIQFPLYEFIYPKWFNYGGMGSIMAGEMLRAIDEEGGSYDKNGNNNQWWSALTRVNYKEKSKCFVDYYGRQVAGPYLLPGGVKKTVVIDGGRHKLTAIAETGGVRHAYYLFKAYESMHPNMQLAPGLNMTNDQAFFVAFAQSKCFQRKDPYAYERVRRGMVPEDIRTNGIVSQLQEFQDNFKCPKGSPMNPDERCFVF